MSDRLALATRAAPAAFVLLLAVASLLPEPDLLSLGSSDADVVERVASTLDALPDAPVVVIGFDPDVGTYPEIRPAVRALLAELMARDAQLVLVSLTPEGRALALAELGRLAAVGDPQPAIVDLGYVAGSEAALASLSRSARAVDAPAALAAELEGDGLGAGDLVVVIGGNDIGPRTWVEQALPRIGAPPTVAIAPTILLPELLPYVESGQLDALIGTPVDGASYRAAVSAAPDGVGGDRSVDRLGVLVGLLVAIGVIGQALVSRALPAVRLARRGERA